MYGGGRGGFGYSSPMDTDPTRPGTQLNPYDQNPNVPGVQNYGGQGGFGQGGYGGVGYASKRDTDPFTQVPKPILMTKIPTFLAFKATELEDTVKVVTDKEAMDKEE